MSVRKYGHIKFMQGIQGSGKTTWAKEFCEGNKDWVRVSRDDIRHMRGQYWIPKDEKMISAMETSLILTALSAGKKVVVDAMNLNHERDIKGRVASLEEEISRNAEEKIEFKLMHTVKSFKDVSLEKCIARDKARANSIGEKVIRRTWEKYLGPEPVVYEESIRSPVCQIYDIDGTLANRTDRGPFDWSRVIEDMPNQPIVDMLRLNSHSRNIFIFSGRDSVCREATVKWLSNYGMREGVEYQALIMRPQGDTRKDSTVKREMFEEHIRGQYLCEFVVDDRDQVVDIWRKELGLTCLQVNYGDF